MTINKSIYFEGKELLAGVYSIFTLPGKKEWTLIINSQTNMWGTDYDSANDLLRIPIKIMSLKEPVELMTIDIKQQDKTGILSISWDRTKAYVPFELEK